MGPKPRRPTGPGWLQALARSVAGGYEASVQTAFKEWAVIVDALGRGDQILILRKGGIHEGKGGFQVEHPEFWLFPTLYHQQGECVIPAAQGRFESLKAAFPPPETLRLQFIGRVEAWRRLEDPRQVERLRGQHIWKDEVIAQRFEWGREQNIFALAVRILRLPSPVDIPMLPSYGGCKSWIQLDPDLPTGEAVPVLTDAEWQERLESFTSSLSQHPVGLVRGRGESGCGSRLC